MTKGRLTITAIRVMVVVIFTKIIVSANYLVYLGMVASNKLNNNKNQKKMNQFYFCLTFSPEELLLLNARS